MNRINTIGDIYRISGMLEVLSNMQGQEITEVMADQLGDCAGMLSIIGQRLIAEEVYGDDREEA